jgi:hypothetical protein
MSPLGLVWAIGPRTNFSDKTYFNLNYSQLINLYSCRLSGIQWGTFYPLIAKFFITKNIEYAKSLWSFFDQEATSKITDELKP